MLLLILSAVLSPWVINQNWFKKSVIDHISRKVEGTVDFQRIELSFFPRPCLQIYKGEICIPGKTRSYFKSALVYPNILPFFIGNIRFRSIQIKMPELEIRLPETTGERKEDGRIFSVASLNEKISHLLTFLDSGLYSGGKHLIFGVENGTFDFIRKDRSICRFEDIHVQIYSAYGKPEFNIRCSSEPWEYMLCTGKISPDGSIIEGSVNLKGFHPQAVVSHFAPATAKRFSLSKVDLKTDFKLDKDSGLNVEIKCAPVILTLKGKTKEFVLTGKGLEGFFHINKTETSITLTELNLDFPLLKLSGNLKINRKTPYIFLEVTAENLDVNFSRKVAMEMAGNKPVIRRIFDIIKGGNVPKIKIQTDGHSVKELGNWDNLTITGCMTDGNIFMPVADLNLEAANGCFTISKGVLAGERLRARLGNSTGSSGALRLGLDKKNNNTFNLDVKIDVDMSQLPPILKRLVKSEPFLKEMEKIDALEGRGQGRLIIGETIDAPEVEVDVSKLNLSARHRQIPYTIYLDSGRFHYDKNTVRVSNLCGRLADSSFSGLSASLDYKKRLFLEMESKSFKIDMEEIFPWLMTFEEIRKNLKDESPVSGIISTSFLNLKGHLLAPRTWRFQMAGRISNFSTGSILFNEQFQVTDAMFEATDKTLHFSNAITKFRDASLNISGSLNGFLFAPDQAELAIEGKLQPDSVRWLTEMVNLPPEFVLRTPLFVSETLFSWEKNKKITLTGRLAVEKGPQISIDIQHTPEELLKICKLTIEDKESKAVLGIRLGEKIVELDFSGNLTQKTIENLQADNTQLPSGWLNGDFHARIDLDKPLASTARGKLSGENIIFPWRLARPLTIKNISLNVDGNRVKTDSAFFQWGNQDFYLKGNVSLEPDEIQINIDAFADSLNWEELARPLKKRESRVSDKGDESFLPFPLSGILKLKTNSFKFNGYTWQPFNADIIFEKEKVKVTVSRSDLCGISTPGFLAITSDKVRVDTKLSSANQDMDETFSCLFDEKGLINGRFDLDGNIFGSGKKERLLQSLQGDLKFNARDGRIYRFGLLTKIFAFLNITEIYRAEIPDLNKKGFAYKSIQATAHLENEKLSLKEFIMNAPTMGIVCQGDIDLANQKLDITVLVAPLKTVDRIVKWIPIVGTVLEGTFISIPVKVTGNLKNPRIVPLSPSAVGIGLFGIMKNVIKLPVTLIQPFGKPLGASDKKAEKE